MSRLDQLFARSQREIEAHAVEIAATETGRYYIDEAARLLAGLRMWAQAQYRSDRVIREILEAGDATALQGWGLPEAFAVLRRLLEARLGKPGKRDYVQVLRLLEVFRHEDVHAAVREALRLGAIGFDAVKHLVLCRIERRPPKLDLAAYPYLPRVTVATTSAKAYLALLGGAAA